jgi:hypothetical protein
MGTAAPQTGQDLLGIYLNDHLAASTMGTGLARRIAGSARHIPASRNVLGRLAGEIAEDRAALMDMMAALSVPIRSYKVYAAWFGEKAGRLKPNGHLLSRSPLSSLEELEILRMAVVGKAAGWRTLRALAERDGRLDAGRLDELLSRADSQAALLEELRAAVADRLAGEEWRHPQPLTGER